MLPGSPPTSGYIVEKFGCYFENHRECRLCHGTSPWMRAVTEAWIRAHHPLRVPEPNLSPNPGRFGFGPEAAAATKRNRCPYPAAFRLDLRCSCLPPLVPESFESWPFGGTERIVEAPPPPYRPQA